MGLGTHGGGAGAVRFLAEHGARIRLTDLRSARDLSQPLSELRDVCFESVRLGWHDAADFRDAEAVVVNPAVPYQHPLLQNLRRQRVPIVTEVGLLWQHTSARVVAVTGSVGKSTTVSLIDAILRESGRRSWLGGNIGGSLLHDTESIAETDWLVLELSSFQLTYLNSIGFRPEIGVVTNFSPNHLDWHGTLDNYRECKQQMFAHQLSSDVAVLNADDGDIMRWPNRASVAMFGSRQRLEPLTASGRRVVFDEIGIASAGFEEPLNAEWSKLPHLNAGPLRQNAACAAAACLAMCVSQAAIIAGLADFTPLPHRCESLGMHAGRWWINDSKATTPAAALAAISACARRPWVLLGGADKQIDMSSFCHSIAHEISGAALVGEMREGLRSLLHRENPQLPLRSCQTLSEAVAWTAKASNEGDVILLSPACSSLDQFRDYADRGEQFRNTVLRLDQLSEFRQSTSAIAPAA